MIVTTWWIMSGFGYVVGVAVAQILLRNGFNRSTTRVDSQKNQYMQAMEYALLTIVMIVSLMTTYPSDDEFSWLKLVIVIGGAILLGLVSTFLITSIVGAKR
jgi:hypothetical protein